MKLGISILFSLAANLPFIMAESTDMIKFTVLHWKVDGVDEQAWKKWYHEQQVPRMIPLMEKHKIDGFKLYITPPSLRESFQEDLDTLKPPGWKMATYDASSEFYVNDPQKLRQMLADPEFDKQVIAFEKGWTVTEKGDVSVGWETTYVKNGKATSCSSSVSK